MASPLSSKMHAIIYIKSISFLIDSDYSNAEFNQTKGLTFLMLINFIQILAMLMDEEKISPRDEREPQLLRGRIMSHLVDEIFSLFNFFCHTPYLSSFTRDPMVKFQDYSQVVELP